MKTKKTAVVAPVVPFDLSAIPPSMLEALLAQLALSAGLGKPAATLAPFPTAPTVPLGPAGVPIAADRKWTISKETEDLKPVRQSKGGHVYTVYATSNDGVRRFACMVWNDLARALYDHKLPRP